MHTNTASDILSLAVCVACLAALAPVMGFHSILGAADFGVSGRHSAFEAGADLSEVGAVSQQLYR